MRTMPTPFFLSIGIGLFAVLVQRADAQSDVLRSLESLDVTKERWCSSYDRADYPYSRSVERDIIRAQSGLFSPYDFTCFQSQRESDVEHIVALAEAHRSGMCGRGGREKERFASDLLNLTLATPKLNREEKIAKDASEWLPPENRCWYAARIVAVKTKYGLSVDKKEKRALKRVLRACEETAMIHPPCR